MTHKPKINKYLWLSAGKSWRFTTSTRHKLVVLFVFALCILPANLCGQSLAIKSNLLYDLTTSLNLGGEIRCDDTHTFSLSVNPEKPDVPLNKNDAFQKVQKRRVQEKR